MAGSRPSLSCPQQGRPQLVVLLVLPVSTTTGWWVAVVVEEAELETSRHRTTAVARAWVRWAVDAWTPWRVVSRGWYETRGHRAYIDRHFHGPLLRQANQSPHKDAVGCGHLHHHGETCGRERHMHCLGPTTHESDAPRVRCQHLGQLECMPRRTAGNPMVTGTNTIDMPRKTFFMVDALIIGVSWMFLFNCASAGVSEQGARRTALPTSDTAAAPASP